MNKLFENKNMMLLLKVFIISLIFITTLVVSQFFLADKIITEEQEYNNNQLKAILTNIDYNNNLLASKKYITNKKYISYLGNRPQNLYIAKNNENTTAIIISTTAPDGYNGDINILVAIKLTDTKQHEIYNIKILQHNETPGLGDLIESNKSNWLQQFIGKVLNIDQMKPWIVKKISNSKYQVSNNYKTSDNTSIDSLTGATITSQAVSNAVQKTLILLTTYPEIYTPEKNI